MESGPVVKTMSLLETMAGGRAPRVLADLAASSGIARPTVHRLLQLLMRLGYVENIRRGSYRLTDKLRQLAMGLDERQLVNLATPALQSLRRSSGETVNLGVLRGAHVSYLIVLESAHPLRRAVAVGESDPFYSTALGRAIVAFLPPTRRAQLLSAEKLESRTPHTITRRAALDAILNEVRGAGYAVEHDQNDLGVTCVSAPLLRDDRIVAAVSLSAASARLTDRRLKQWIRLVRECAERLSAALGSSKFVPRGVEQ